MNLEQKVEQVQSLSPQTIQCLEILQMNTPELIRYVRELSMENPVFEVEMPEIPVAPREREQGRMEWLASNDRQNRWYNRQDNERSDHDQVENQSESLQDYVRSQLPQQGEELENASEYLLQSLDENGWIEESLDELSTESGIPRALLERALVQIQNAEPYGVGARNLQECLLIQLYRMPDADDIAAKIVRDYLPELAKSHFNSIAKALQTTQVRVRQAARQIQQLNPRPANGFNFSEPTSYIVPDLIAKWNGDSFDIRLSKASVFRINISDYYVRLQKESTDREVTQYLDEKVRQARWVYTAVNQRQETMLRCMQMIKELQPEYFKHDKGALRPMTLEDVAERLGVHESTISRAIRGKYIQCPDGVVPLAFFFSQAAFCTAGGENTVSSVTVKKKLQELIQAENTAKPCSDQKLCELLQANGFNISRRTVAKYRDELNIPPATGRKKI